MSGIVFIVSAPSGAGKSSLVAALRAEERNMQLSVSYTTRAPRLGETDGKEYFFVSKETFELMRERNEFLEWAAVYGNMYGTSRPWLTRTLEQGKDVVLEIDWQGAAQVRRLYRDTVSVFILPPSLQALKARLETRAKDAPEVIAQRLAAARDDIRHAQDFDYVIINNEFPEAVRDLTGVVRAERLRRERQMARYADLIAQLCQ